MDTSSIKYPVSRIILTAMIPALCILRLLLLLLCHERLGLKCLAFTLQ